MKPTKSGLLPLNTRQGMLQDLIRVVDYHAAPILADGTGRQQHDWALQKLGSFVVSHRQHVEVRADAKKKRAAALEVLRRKLSQVVSERDDAINQWTRLYEEHGRLFAELVETRKALATQSELLAEIEAEKKA